MSSSTKQLAYGLLTSAVLLASACQKHSVDPAAPSTEVSAEAKAKIKALGFNSNSVRRSGSDYVVEGDIRLTEADLASNPERIVMRVGTEEHYRTNNLVGGLPKQITINISDQFPLSYARGLDEAIRRYNALGLRLTFKKVTTTVADIKIVRDRNAGVGEATFPVGGRPGARIGIDPTLASAPGEIATNIAHEIGHCIGFRHTDYATRSSCGGSDPEGKDPDGAILIEGTPSGADANSWMLACGISGQDYPFTANDKKALAKLYGANGIAR